MDWAKQEEASHLKKYGAEGDQHECITCAEPMGAIPKWSCECCGFLVGTQGDHEGCGDNMDGTVVCNHCYQEGHEVTEMVSLDLGEVIFNSTCKGWDNEKHFGDREYEIVDEYVLGAEDWVRPKKDAELCPNFDTAKGPLSGPCWDCEVCTKNGMTQEKLQGLIDTGWFHKDGTPKADKDGTALLMIEPGEPYVKSGLPAHPRGSAHLGHQPSDYNLSHYGAETFEAPYAGAGALMGIKGDSALSSFTPSELTESSAIHGDFDQASLNYSGHQNLEVRAESHDEVCEYGNPLFVLKGHTHGYCVEPSCENSYCVTERKNEWEAEGRGGHHRRGHHYKGRLGARRMSLPPGTWESPLKKTSCCCGATIRNPCDCMKTGDKCSGSCACSTKEAEYKRPTPKWAKPLGLIGGVAAGYISAQMIDNAKE